MDTYVWLNSYNNTRKVYGTNTEVNIVVVHVLPPVVVQMLTTSYVCMYSSKETAALYLGVTRDIISLFLFINYNKSTITSLLWVIFTWKLYDFYLKNMIGPSILIFTWRKHLRSSHKMILLSGMCMHGLCLYLEHFIVFLYATISVTSEINNTYSNQWILLTLTSSTTMIGVIDCAWNISIACFSTIFLAFYSN